MSKETKGRRRKRVFSGMNIADLRLLKEHKALPRGMKAEELDAEIERREKIAAGMVNQPRAGGRFAAARTATKEHPRKPEGELAQKAETLEGLLRKVIREELGQDRTKQAREAERVMKNVLEDVKRAKEALEKAKRRGLWQKLFGWNT